MIDLTMDISRRQFLKGVTTVVYMSSVPSWLANKIQPDQPFDVIIRGEIDIGRVITVEVSGEAYLKGEVVDIACCCSLGEPWDRVVITSDGKTRHELFVYDSALMDGRKL